MALEPHSGHDRAEIAAQHRRHTLHSLLILLAIGGVLTGSAFLVAGRPGVLLAGGALVVTFLFAPRFSGSMLLRRLGGQPLDPSEAPWLYRAAATLSKRAGLPQPPIIYGLPSQELNAVTVDTAGHRPIIAITRGLAESLNRRQMAGVLAHELAHLRNGDLTWLHLATQGIRLTTLLYRMGLFLMVFSLPLAFTGRGRIPLLGGLLLFAAPVVAQLLALALSRSREFDADAVAAALTGDPEGLASALEALEGRQRPLWARMMWPAGQPRRASQPRNVSWLQSHPPPQERARRLRRLLKSQRPPRWSPSDWDDSL
ncbi:MAG: zinc metalloprotease HtpX [Bradymonadia bacterium]